MHRACSREDRAERCHVRLPSTVKNEMRNMRGEASECIQVLDRSLELREMPHLGCYSQLRGREFVPMLAEEIVRVNGEVCEVSECMNIVLECAEEVLVASGLIFESTEFGKDNRRNNGAERVVASASPLEALQALREALQHFHGAVWEEGSLLRTDIWEVKIGTNNLRRKDLRKFTSEDPSTAKADMLERSEIDDSLAEVWAMYQQELGEVMTRVSRLVVPAKTEASQEPM